MRKRILILLSIILATVGIVSWVTAQSDTDQPEGNLVLPSSIFVRGGPGEQFVPVGALYEGDIVTPVNRSVDGFWILIPYNRSYGWVQRNLIQWENNAALDLLPILEANITPEPIPPTREPVILPTFTPEGNYVALADAESAYLRAGPGRTYLRLGQLFAGDSVEPVAQNVDGSWIMIRYQNDRTDFDGFAWISRTLIHWEDESITDALPIVEEDALTPTLTFTPSGTPEPTDTETPSVTPSDTATATDTPTDTATPTDTETPSVTPSDTATATDTPTDTVTPSETATDTETPSVTPSDTATATATVTPSETATDTPIPTDTPTDEPSNTPTDIPTDTPIPSDTPTEQVEVLVVATDAPTETPVPSDTATDIPTATDTVTPSETATDEPTETPVPSDTATLTDTATDVPTETPIPSDTATDIPTDEPTETPTDEATQVAAAAVQTEEEPSETPEEGAIVLPETAIPTEATIIEVEPDTGDSGGFTIPIEAVIGLSVLVLVLGYIFLFWRGLAAADRYREGFVIEECPVCKRGGLHVEEKPGNLLGIPQIRRTVRCDVCRSVLRETGAGKWRYAVDRIENSTMYDRFNGKEISDDELVRLSGNPPTGSGRPTNPEFVDEDNPDTSGR